MKRLRLWLLAAILPLAGCHHGRVRTAVPPAPPTPEPPPVAVSVPPPTHPTEPIPKSEERPEPAPAATAPAKVRGHRKGSNAGNAPAGSTPASSAPAAAPTPAPATPAPAATIDLGNLTTGNESGGALRQESADLIRNQNDRLAKLPPPVQHRYTRQLDQVRLFLKQAQDSWQASDYEGAKTLSTKAKVLIDEIQRP